jgi:hypothetical protein
VFFNALEYAVELGYFDANPTKVGELLLTGSSPTTGARWSDTGQRRDKRDLKHRAAQTSDQCPALHHSPSFSADTLSRSRTARTPHSGHPARGDLILPMETEIGESDFPLWTVAAL